MHINEAQDSMGKHHIKGRDLSQSFYKEIVKPLIDIVHGAALVGEGSEVLGYDTVRSTDHNWGPHVTIFVNENDIEITNKHLTDTLPCVYMGHTISLEKNLEVVSLQQWLQKNVHLNDWRSMEHWEWLSIPQQHLLQFAAGQIFHDATGEIAEAMDKLSYYPHNIRLWMMASQWYQIGIHEPMLHRVLEVNDFIGAKLLMQKLIRYCMELRYMQEQIYWPYDKWFGTAFSTLPKNDQFNITIEELLKTTDVSIQLTVLRQLMVMLGNRHNELQVTNHIEPQYSKFCVGIDDAIRPYDVINAGEYKDACLNEVTEPRLKNMLCVGGIDQLTHANDALINFTEWPMQLRKVYKENIDKSLKRSYG